MVEAPLQNLDQIGEALTRAGLDPGLYGGVLGRLRDFCDRYAADGNAYQGARAAFTQDRSHAEVIYEAGKCIACGICIRLAAEAGEKLGLAFLGRGFDVRVGAPFGGQLVDALGRSARTCVEHCPTGALALREEA